MLSELAGKGVQIRACGTCMKSRGITDAELVEGVQRGTMMILAGWVKESDRVVAF
jgi:sulfur relay (sulfurtransferase) complex TusBCD TusD component (DsrE family)